MSLQSQYLGTHVFEMRIASHCLPICITFFLRLSGHVKDEPCIKHIL